MTTPAIPASSIVSVIPGVIGAGGTGLDLNGLALTPNTRVPIGTVASFPTADDVSSYFGPASVEAALADVYFLGYDNSFIKPAAMLFAQYPQTAVAAYLRGGNLGSMTLSQLQAITGVLTITIDGTAFTSSSINLSSATSFSNAAQLIQTALAAKDAAVTGAIAGTTLTVSTVGSGTVAVGQTVSGSGVTAGTVITALGSGTGGTGTYTVSPSQTASSTALTLGAATVTFDSVSNAFVVTSGMSSGSSTITVGTGSIAAPLLLTSATGAVTSQGAAAATPGAFMDGIAAQTQDWATFFTSFMPNQSDALAFAAWTNGKGNRYTYALWDTDSSPTTQNPATGSLGYLIAQADYSGTALIYEPGADLYQAAMLAGFAASIDFTRTNARPTMAFRSQTGMAVGVSSDTAAANLIANGYNFYGRYSTANDAFNFFYPGSVSGPFKWLDSYYNEIWLNNQLQLALMELLTQVPSIPYNQAGYALIEAACNDPIQAALNFGAIRPGVVLSSAQVAEVNNAAGLAIAGTLQTRGWYLQVVDPGAQVRVNRGSPVITLWYLDGQSVQRLTLSSLEVQ